MPSEKLKKDRYFVRVGYTFNDVAIWGQYERMVDFIFDEYSKTGRRYDEISQPLLFNISHSIELALKENIKFFREYLKNNKFIHFNNYNQFIKGHNLKALSKEFKCIFTVFHKQVKGDITIMNEFKDLYKDFITLLDILDRNTPTYRYSTKLDRYGNSIEPSIHFSKVIDFIELKALYEKSKKLLFGSPNIMAIYTDYIDFTKANEDYKKGDGRLLFCKMNHSDHSLKLIEDFLKEKFVLNNNEWIDESNQDKYEIKIWNNDIYVIKIK